MKIFTLGGGFVSDHLPYPVIRDRIVNDQDIEDIIKRYDPDVLINCIGRTGNPTIDWCESNRVATIEGNFVIPTMIAQACQRRGIHMVQIGSGCIFVGESTDSSGWKENDQANPKSWYSKTKWACDQELGRTDLYDNVTILRIRMPISHIDNDRNLINKLKKYQKIIDIPNSVTMMKDLVRCIDWVVDNKYLGIYHVTNPRPITAVDVMEEYRKYFPDHKYEIIDEKALDLLTVAKRSNCILNTDKLIGLGFRMQDAREALAECMKEYAANIK